ncbi:hypothetical protein CYMTET_16015, partial [Cymbomonas tetramitiformis]
YGRFCSAYLDVDRPFGSLGSAFEFCPQEGCFEANPPFEDSLIQSIGTHVEGLVAAASKPLMFIFIFPRWPDKASWQHFAKSSWLLHQITIQAK